MDSVKERGEVFTPEFLVKDVCDLIKDYRQTFLEPSCGTGNFLVEILKRKLKIMDSVSALSGIYGVEIYPESVSVCKKRLLSMCGGLDKEKEILDKNILCGDFLEMDIPWSPDVVIGNPPYQKLDGGNASSSIPVYNLFIDKSKALNPKYISMIVPSRWLFLSNKLPKKFREEMLHDKQITVLYDFVYAKELFKNVCIRGGVCYFLWERGANKKCEIHMKDDASVVYSKRYLCEEGDKVHFRYPILLDIKNKVKGVPFSNILSQRNPYGLEGYHFKRGLNSEPTSNNRVRVLSFFKGKRVVREIDFCDLPKTQDNLYKYKVFLPAVFDVEATPFLAEPGVACTDTYITTLEGFETRKEAENVFKYTKSKFFIALLNGLRQTIQAPRGVYELIPMQDFSAKSDIDWDKPLDTQLYKKYGLSDEEVTFMENAVCLMRS